MKSEKMQSPLAWKSVRLADVVGVNKLSINSRTNPDYIIEYIDIASIESPGRKPKPRTIRYRSAPSRARRIVRSGDVLVSTVRPYLRAFSQINTASNNLIASTGFAVLSVNEGIVSDYLSQVVLSDSFVRYLTNRMTGSNYPSVTADDVGSYEMILPPESEQYRVAEILDTMDRTITQTERLIEKLRAIKSGLLHDLLTMGIGVDGLVRNPEKQPEEFKETKLGTIPAQWSIAALDDVSKIVSGYHIPLSYQNESEEGLPLFKVKEISDCVESENKFLSSARVHVSIKNSLSLGAKPYAPGTLVFAKRGAALLLNRRAVLARESIIDSNVMGIYPSSDELEISYLYYYFLTVDMADYVKTTALPAIDIGNIAPIQILIPPLDEQMQVVQILDTISKRIEIEDIYRKKVNQIKTGLMSDLLTGRVRVKVSKEKSGES